MESRIGRSNLWGRGGERHTVNARERFLATMNFENLTGACCGSLGTGLKPSAGGTTRDCRGRSGSSPRDDPRRKRGAPIRRGFPRLERGLSIAGSWDFGGVSLIATTSWRIWASTKVRASIRSTTGCAPRSRTRYSRNTMTGIVEGRRRVRQA